MTWIINRNLWSCNTEALVIFLYLLWM